MPAKKDLSLRARKKAVLRADLVECAVTLFLERGFKRTLVDDIAAAAGVSRRTFFHYFPAKQDVILDWFRLQGEHLALAFSERSIEEEVWDSLLVAFLNMRDHFGKGDSRVVELQRLVHLEPALLAKKYDFFVFVAELLFPPVRTRIGKTKDGNLVAHVLIQSAIAAYNAANSEWAAKGNAQPFEPIAKRAFRLAAPSAALKC